MSRTYPVWSIYVKEGREREMMQLNKEGKHRAGITFSRGSDPISAMVGLSETCPRNASMYLVTDFNCKWMRN